MPARTLERWNVQLAVVFGAIVACFVAASALAHAQLAGIDRASLDIAENASPSIEHLATARDRMRRMQAALREYVDARRDGRAVDRAAQDIEDERRATDAEIAEYLHLPVFPGELDLWSRILRARAALAETVARCVGRADAARLDDAEAALRDDVAPAADALASAITRDIEFNAGHSHDLALHIRALRARSWRLAIALDAACAFVAIAGAFALRRAMRAYATLSERHRALEHARARELDEFAGRVAHDILSPLGAVHLALDLAREGDDAERARALAAGARSLERVQRLVTGLLDFARSGARSDPDALASIDAVLASLAPDLQREARLAGAELRVAVDARGAAACNPGVLTSLVANLARNAIKYIGDAPARRIEIRAFERRGALRVEVEDTGPGLPIGLEARVFEPYVRGPRSLQSGIGLGLATVKRLVEAHGGELGVRSVAGVGCTFWFELPLAGEGPAHAREEGAGGALPAASR